MFRKAPAIGGESSDRRFLERTFRVMMFGVALSILLGIVLSFQFLAGRYQFNLGDASPYDIRSPRKVPSFVSPTLTREERDRAAAAVTERLEFDPGIAPQQRQAAITAFNRIGEIRRSSSSRQQKQQDILAIPNIRLSVAQVDEIVAMDEGTWQLTRDRSLQTLEQLNRASIREDNLEEVRRSASNLVDGSTPESIRTVAAALASSFVKPNYVINQPATNEARRKARDEAPLVQISLARGEIILREGETVKATDLEKLEAAGLRNPSLNWYDIISVALLVLCCTGVIVLYLHLFRHEIVDSQRSLLLLTLIIVVTALTAKFVIPGREDFAFVFPVATGAMLIALLLDSEIAFVAALPIGVLVGIVGNSSFELGAAGLLSSFVGIIGIWRSERFSRFFLTGLGIAAVTFAVVASFELGTGEPEMSRVIRMLIISAANGGLSASLALGTVWLLGHLFGITTTLGLLELGNQTQPLFRRLFLEAPGTYQHSMLVADLATRASQEIGADALLARVGAYYHDIGKILHPYDFIENQVEGQNIHDLLEPEVSAQRVLSHTAQGLRLARQYGLPSKVQDILAEHHGTNLTQYFYRKAQEKAGARPLPEAQFRYPGPRPRTRESAIVMLADAVEAAVRASPDHSIEKIGKTVNRIINDRLADGQLAECDLTLRDIDIIRQTFVRVLKSIYHPRIAYPEAPSAVEVQEATPALPSGQS